MNVMFIQWLSNIVARGLATLGASPSRNECISATVTHSLPHNNNIDNSILSEPMLCKKTKTMAVNKKPVNLGKGGQLIHNLCNMWSVLSVQRGDSAARALR